MGIFSGFIKKPPLERTESFTEKIMPIAAFNRVLCSA
jgi:hypothetical protein